MTTCIKCKTNLAPDESFCDECGTQQPQTIFCDECGAALEPGVDFCDSCGTSTQTTPKPHTSEQPKAKPAPAKSPKKKSSNRVKLDSIYNEMANENIAAGQEFEKKRDYKAAAAEYHAAYSLFPSNKDYKAMWERAKKLAGI
jgi:predicted amidophosphoribosyltransferase